MLIRSFAGAAVRLAFATFAIAAFSAAAEAQYITYVASNGNDANPCTVVTAPCKTLQRTVNVTLANGTVRVLTPLISSVFVNKNITISGDDVPIVGQITIGGANAVVTLRGLALNGVGGWVNGVRIDSAAAVHIEDVTLERYTSAAIFLSTTAATKLFISDSIASTSSDGLFADASSAQVVIQNSHFDQNNANGAYIKVSKATVTGSSASGNAVHGFIFLGGRAKVTETTADNNSGDGFAIRSSAFVFLKSAEAIGNSAAGLHLEINGGTAVLDDCMLVGQGTGAAAGVYLQDGTSTRRNNTVWISTGAAEPLDAF